MPVLYLKYRPQTLGDLMGQANVKQALLGAFQNQKLSHAYLFVGPRGTGKTSTARILAKMVNCTGDAGPTVPCNKCDSCISITDGSSLDLIEIDAASNRGIDDIRSLRENIKLAPNSSNKKIYIIDEVHMLTTEAFNALLKTLEEPPAHVMFILATTEVSKVPQTILSRCSRLDFSLASIDELTLALKKIAEGEKLKIDDEALRIIAKKADGSFRDGVKLLDQVSSSGEVTVKIVEDSFRDGGMEITGKLLDAFSKKDAKAGLTLVLEATNNGANIKELTLSLMDLLRNLVYVKNGLEIATVDKELIEKFSLKDLVLSLDKLQEALEKMKTSSIPSLPLELAIVEICTVGQYIGISVEQKETVTVKENVIASEARPASTQRGEQSSQNEQSTSAQPIPVSDFIPAATGDDIKKLHDNWTIILENIRPFNYSLEALLRNVNIQRVEEGIVFLEVPYSFHQRILESPKSRDLLESVLAEVLSKPVKISVVLGVRPQRVEDIANVEIAQDDEIVSLASEIFNGKLID